MELPTQLPDFGPSHPPCLICHGKASGTHYGVNSCEACKVGIVLIQCDTGD